MPSTSDDDSELSRCWREWIVERDYGGTDSGKLGALNAILIAVKQEMESRGVKEWTGSIWPN